ncbi:methionine ABC transporter ATP-binding protein [Sulfurospirillum arcachonense]|uniref:methionine ABC transporter ATP-binding protein n=1 Tax=Sulfurospirillum arcachonense TaxID=57666 RepID=UPI000468EAE8|nr:methionine ABC transporter ATP-binding protein [Sulfurospirillum arcachonense]
MIEIKNLDKYFGNDKVLNNISLKIDKGEIFAMVGHSGAGKSTLLRCINGLESYEIGTLKVFDKEVKNLSTTELKSFRKDVGMIFQHFSLMQRKNVFDNIALPMQVWGFSKDEIKVKVDELLKLIDLSHKSTAYPSELSGGQKQRVAIARALTLDPQILLSDEATSALDPNTTTSILDLLKKINKELGITIIIVTHEMDVVKAVAQKAILLEHGNIIGQGEIEDLFLQPDKKMKKFLGEKEVIPEDGENIKLYFPKEIAQYSIITHMARTLNIDFNIVWGKLEKINNHVIGSLVINITASDKESVTQYLDSKNVTWEIL